MPGLFPAARSRAVSAVANACEFDQFERATGTLRSEFHGCREISGTLERRALLVDACADEPKRMRPAAHPAAAHSKIPDGCRIEARVPNGSIRCRK